MQSILNTRLKFILKTNFELIILQKINSNIKLSKRNKTWSRSFSQPKPKFLAFSHSICYSWIHCVDSKLIPYFHASLSLSTCLSPCYSIYLSPLLSPLSSSFLLFQHTLVCNSKVKTKQEWTGTIRCFPAAWTQSS